jgi:hypothetical protein
MVARAKSEFMDVFETEVKFNSENARRAFAGITQALKGETSGFAQTPADLVVRFEGMNLTNGAIQNVPSFQTIILILTGSIPSIVAMVPISSESRPNPSGEAKSVTVDIGFAFDNVESSALDLLGSQLSSPMAQRQIGGLGISQVRFKDTNYHMTATPEAFGPSDLPSPAL